MEFNSMLSASAANKNKFHLTTIFFSVCIQRIDWFGYKTLHEYWRGNIYQARSKQNCMNTLFCKNREEAVGYV